MPNFEPHPFARFVRILGRGKSFTRSLTFDEAEEAMEMILAGDVLPEQLGAFLMLLRLKEESAEEIAGFAKAARKRFPASSVRVDVDWPSYAGKRRQLPWFILSALVLARNGWPVFMHGFDGHTAGRLYTGETLQALGAPVARDLNEAARDLARQNFAYAPLECFSPQMARMMSLRPILGLRSPVHTLARMLNPFDAPCLLQGVFHPGYLLTHRDAALLLGQSHMAAVRGEGGEFERRPAKPCDVLYVAEGVAFDERWPPIIAEPRQAPDENMEIGRLLNLWRGESSDAYGEAAVVGTLAIALRAMGVVADMDAANAHAAHLWANRDRGRLLAAA